MSRRIVVTGVSRGLGRALAESFIRQGHQVAGCARSESAIAELSAEHPDHRFHVVDVTSETSVAQWADQAIDDGGPPDLLVNNAALINRNARLWEAESEDFERVVDVNIKGVFYVIKHFAPAMIAAGSGVIVNFSSTWGRTTSAEVAPYCATKWAIEGLSRALAQELPSGLASVAFNPGVINTAMLQSCFGDSAGMYPGPEAWAQRAAPFLLLLDAGDNGRSVDAP